MLSVLFHWSICLLLCQYHAFFYYYSFVIIARSLGGYVSSFALFLQDFLGSSGDRILILGLWLQNKVMYFFSHIDIFLYLTLGCIFQFYNFFETAMGHHSPFLLKWHLPLVSSVLLSSTCVFPLAQIILLILWTSLSWNGSMSMVILLFQRITPLFTISLITKINLDFNIWHCTLNGC